MGINGIVAFLAIGFITSCHAAGIPCPITGSTPCVCTPRIIDCTGHNLPQIPVFKASSDDFTVLKLSHNNLTTVPTSAFASLNVTDIDLSYNQINHMDDGAFGGIFGFLRVLNLAHNNLTVLPNTIQTLLKIEELDVTYNPIPGYVPHGHHGTDTGLLSNIMRAIGDSIITFKFGSSIIDDRQSKWPKSLSHLNQLQELTVAGVNIFYWPPDSFHGFERTLRRLYIDDMSIGAVPVGLAYLTNLEELHLDNLKPPFGDDSMISLPFGQLAKSLKVLSLINDQLTEFPAGIKDLDELKELTLDGNDLQFVSDEAIQLLKNANVTLLSLKNCNLKRVPGAISDLKVLHELDLSHNLIRSIESTDLQNLASLNTLKMDQNPLKYISDNSLCGLNKLRSFSLVNTSLTDVSRSFKNLKELQDLDLTLSKIDCTCDLTWMKYWNDTCIKTGTTLKIMGECETIDQGIENYIGERLRDCPGYYIDIRTFVCNGTCIAK